MIRNDRFTYWMMEISYFNTCRWVEDVFYKWELIEEVKGQRFVCQTLEVSGIYVLHKFYYVLNVFAWLKLGFLYWQMKNYLWWFDFLVKSLRGLGREKLTLKTSLDYGCKEKWIKVMNDHFDQWLFQSNSFWFWKFIDLKII